VIEMDNFILDVIVFATVFKLTEDLDFILPYYIILLYDTDKLP
jgi:hypothetical protein